MLKACRFNRKLTWLSRDVILRQKKGVWPLELRKQERCRDAVCHYREKAAKAQLKLNLTGTVRENKKVFQKCQQQKEVTLIHYLMRLVNSQAGMQTKQAFNVVFSVQCLCRVLGHLENLAGGL